MQLQLRPAILSYAPDGLPSRHCLSEYCHLMDWGFEQVDAPKLVPSALERLEGCDLVLIDSPCVRPGDVEAMEALRATLTAAEVSQTHLVMSALTGAPHFRRALAWYQQLEPSHLLLTKLDEAHGLSGIYSSVLASHLPLGFASTGPGVPEDLIELDAVQAVRWVLGD
jgi:flagellar biosynthesis protein FlhF